MRNTYTAVVERTTPVRGELCTEPYEAGWANEALVFLRVREEELEGLVVTAKVQISPDGIEWVDHGVVLEPTNAVGMQVGSVTHFGNWLRLMVTTNSGTRDVRISVHLVLKG